MCPCGACAQHSGSSWRGGEVDTTGTIARVSEQFGCACFALADFVELVSLSLGIVILKGFVNSLWTSPFHELTRWVSVTPQKRTQRLTFGHIGCAFHQLEMVALVNCVLQE